MAEGPAHVSLPPSSAPGSSIYVGRVRHRRFSPRPHEFGYRLYMSYLDLDQVSEALDAEGGWRRFLVSSHRPALVRYRRADYFGDPELDLAESVRRLVAEHTGHRPAGPIRLLTHLRTWGLGFNPVSFYYCFDASGSQVEHVVTEITNTPWDERHCYVLDAPSERRSGVATYHLRKSFHVSPFMGMDVDYRWKFSEPGERLLVHMENLPTGETAADQKLFDATLSLERQGPLSAGALLRNQVRFPAMTAMVMFWIYRQALGLWAKKTPFHAHPAQREKTNSRVPGAAGTTRVPSVDTSRAAPGDPLP